jgi:hypothetical protein
MKPSTKSISLTSSDARLIRKACLTFTDVPFSAAKPRFESDVIPFLDTLFDLLLEKRRQLKIQRRTYLSDCHKKSFAICASY